MSARKCHLADCDKSVHFTGDDSNIYGHTPEGIRVFFCSEGHLKEYERNQSVQGNLFNRVIEEQLDIDDVGE